MLTEGLIRKWYSENALRRFPLRDDASGVDIHGNRLPDGLLVGIDLCIPYTMTDVVADVRQIVEEAHPYISKVIITPAEIQVEVSAGIYGPAAIAVASMAEITTSPNKLGFPFAPAKGVAEIAEDMAGFVVFGPVEGFRGAEGIYEFAYEDGSSSISAECIHAYPEGVRALVVNGIRLSGDVVLKAGRNIDIRIENENEVVISSTVGTQTVAGGIYTPAQLLTRVTEALGEPILTINGIRPTEDGEFFLLPAEDECLSIVPLETGNGLEIGNPCASPCCDKSELLKIATDLQTLNEKYGRLHSYLVSASGNLNSLQNELSVLKQSLY